MKRYDINEPYFISKIQHYMEVKGYEFVLHLAYQKGKKVIVDELQTFEAYYDGGDIELIVSTPFSSEEYSIDSIEIHRKEIKKG